MFLLLLIGEKSQALCYVSNRHGSFSRISHYFRINFNSFMQKKPKSKQSGLLCPKYSTIDSRLILFFTGRSQKLWFLPESILKQDASTFLNVGEHTRFRSPPDAFLKALF